jgi:hypothetical protein
VPVATQKFYLANATSDLNPPISSWWEDTTNGATARALTTAPTGTNVASTRAETSTSATFDVLLGRWVSPPIQRAGTLEASTTVVDLVWAVQAAATTDFRSSYTVRVVTSAGADRGYLLTNSGQNGIAGGTAWGTTLTGKQENTPDTFATSVAVQPGDRVVVELGYRPQNTVSTSRSGTIRYGGTATTDLAAGDTGTNATTRPAWIRFTGPNSSDLWLAPNKGAASGLWQFAGAAAGAAPRVKISELVDDFSAGVLDTVKWDGSYGGVDVVSGQGRIPCTTAYPAIATASVYDLTGSSISGKFTPPDTAGGGGSREYSLTLAASAGNVVNTFVAGGTLFMRLTTAGVNSDATLPYSATDHAWWRISEAAGTLTWETSPDGATWTVRRSVAHSLTLTAVTVTISCGYWGTETAANGFVDNINVAPEGPKQGSASGSWQFTGSATGSAPLATTRFYLTSASAPYRPLTVNSVWNNNSKATTPYLLGRTKAGDPAVSSVTESTTTSPYYALLGQWVSAPATGDGSIAGGNHQYTIARFEDDAGADMVMTAVIRVLAGPATGTTRGTASAAFGNVEFPTSAQAVTVTGTPSEVAYFAGDRIVVEIGYRAQNTTATPYTGSLAFGGTGTDLASGDTDLSKAPWIDLPVTAGTFNAVVGSATGTFSWEGAASGSAPAVLPRTGSASGVWSFAGAAAGAATRRGSASGSWTFTGTAAGRALRKGGASGSWQVTGSAAGVSTRRGAAAGAWMFTAAATGSAPVVEAAEGAAAGAMAWTGAATGRTARRGAGTGAWSFTGAASGRTVRRGSGTGTWSTSGAAAGRTTRRGTASGSLTYAGTAVGDAPVVPVNAGTGAGVWSFTSTAAGKKPARGSASGSWSTTGGASGRTSHSGSASGTFKYMGVALSGNVRAGAATGGWAFTGAASGRTTKRGTAVGTWQYASTAAGKRSRAGSASGAWGFAGAGTGRTTRRGSATGTWAYVGTAAAPNIRTGTASGAWAFTSSAIGRRVAHGSTTGLWVWVAAANGTAPDRSPRYGAAVGEWEFVGWAHGGIPVIDPGRLHAGVPRPGEGLSVGTISGGGLSAGTISGGGFRAGVITTGPA